MPELKTPLYDLHRELGGKMVPFAGYSMPVQFSAGVLKEHLHTRSQAGLFDVSHMGQIVARGDDAAAILESVLPLDLQALPVGQQRYAVLLNEDGGMRDDLIVTRWDETTFFLVVNAACKQDDLAWFRARCPELDFQLQSTQALLALQGPRAREVLAAQLPEIATLAFMQGRPVTVAGEPAYVTCSGYTGEDGFEISLPATVAESVARTLLADDRVAPIGLGARDSLRLEAGLCLYGHDMDASVTPVEAGLQWSINPVRRAGGDRAGGFPGADRVLAQMVEGVPKRRVGLQIEGRAPVREGAELVDSDGIEVGRVTSGGFGPTLNAPVAMAMVDRPHFAPGTRLFARVRNKLLAVTVVKTPFVPQRYFRG